MQAILLTIWFFVSPLVFAYKWKLCASFAKMGNLD